MTTELTGAAKRCKSELIDGGFLVTVCDATTICKVWARTFEAAANAALDIADGETSSELLAETERLRARVAELEANEPKPKLIWEINKHSGIDETSKNQELRSQNLLIRADWPVSYYKIMPFRDGFFAYIVGFDKDQNRSIKQIGPRLATSEGAKTAC